MSDLYLIAHKVRGEPAFDIAQRMCEGDDPCQPNCGLYPNCKDEEIWIIPTSGHRAFPYWHIDINNLLCETGNGQLPAMPPSLHDHYTTTAEASIDLIKVLGLIHKPLAPIKRRF